MADQTDCDLAHYEATERRDDLHWRASIDLMVHYTDTAADIGIGVLRTAILINAGALVALLAFVAQIWPRWASSTAVRCASVAVVIACW